MTSPSSIAVFICFLVLAGCGAEQNSAPSSLNEIESYIQKNPGAIAKPEDSPADESAEFDVDDGSE